MSLQQDLGHSSRQDLKRGEQQRQSVPSGAQDAHGALDLPHAEFDFRGPWFCSKVAAAYVGNKNVRAFYSWCERHFIVRRSNGTVAKVDLDRALRARKPKRRMHPNTLANLRTRWDRGRQNVSKSAS